MKWTAIFFFVFASCSSGHEMVMPFFNYGYSSDRLFPGKFSDAEYSFRIWVNNSTSIDRVISISKDSLDYSFRGYFTEIGKLSDGKKSKPYYRQIKIEPKSGFKVFKKEIDSLDLLNVATQTNELELPEHQGVSIYVVEFKDHNKFNTFYFETYYPYKGEINEKYAAIEKLIFKEFDIHQYFKFEE